MTFNNYASLVGEQARDKTTGEVLGIITAVNCDDGRWWAVIDDSYEVGLAGSELVIEITKGTNYVNLA